MATLSSGSGPGLLDIREPGEPGRWEPNIFGWLRIGPVIGVLAVLGIGLMLLWLLA